MAAYSGSGDAEVVEQLLRLACVFAGDAVNPLEHVERAQGDIAEVANGSGYEIETWRQWCGINGHDWIQRYAQKDE